MTCSFHPLAQAELQRAIDYYNGQKPGLGDRFSAEIFRTIQRIVAHPQGWTKLSNTTRRCLTTGFPYGVIYQVRSDCLAIVAIMHLHRKPTHWKDRL
jgi:plasmid stabilization system protein ParE